MFGTSSDAAVIRRVLAGRHEDFAVLVARHMPMARALARARLRHPQDVEDVVQEAFLKAYRSLDTLRDVGHFGAWLGAIVRNTCANFYRAQHAREAIAADVPLVASAPPALEQEEMQRLVRTRLDELDEASREILLLHYYAGRSTREIAVLLNVSRDAVKKRMQRARESLGQVLLQDLAPNEAERRDAAKHVRAVMGALPLVSPPWAGAAAAGGALATAGVAKIMTAVALAAVLTVAGVAVWKTAKAGDPDSGVTASDAVSDGTGAASPSSGPASSGESSTKSREQGVFSGKVQNAETREPIPDIEVRIFPGDHAEMPVEGGRTVRTAADGSFEFRDVVGDIHTVFIEDPWFAKVVQPVRLSPVGSVPAESAAELMLPPNNSTLLLTPAGIVSGRVYDKETGAGVGGVEIAAQIYERPPKTVSAADGTYRLVSVPAGDQRILRGITGDYAYMIEGEEKRLDIRHKEEIHSIDFPLEHGITIDGTTVGMDGKAVGGVALRIGVINTQTLVGMQSREDGSFVLSNFPRQSTAWYDLEPREYERGLALPFHNQLELGAEDVQHCTIRVERAARVSGRITTPAGEGVAGATIVTTYEYPDGSGTINIGPSTEESGFFESRPLYPGEYALVLEPPACEGASQSPQALATIILGPGEVKEGLNFIYDASGGLSIAGRIVDQDGNPLPGVAFAVFGPFNQTRGQTDATGNFRVTGLEEGIHQLTYFELTGDAFGPRPPTIADAYDSERVVAGTQDVEIHLELQAPPEPGGSISGTVMDAETGAPVTQFSFELRPGIYDVLNPDSNYVDFWGSIGHPLTRQSSSADGTFSIEAFTADAHTFLVEAPGYAPHISAVTPGSANMQIALTRGATIRGMVTDYQGRPVSGAIIIRGTLEMLHMVSMLNEQRDARVLAMSRNDGTFEATNVELQLREISAVHPDLGTIAKMIAPRPGAATNVTFQFAPSGALAGNITMGEAPAGKGGVEFHTTDGRFVGNFWSDNAGALEVRGLPAGPYTAWFTLQQHAGSQVVQWRKRVDIEIVPDQATRIDVDFPPGETTLYGLVTVDGNPITAIASVQVVYSEGDLTASTEVNIENGAYRIDGLAGGDATLRFPSSWEGIEFDRNEVDVTLPKSGALEQDIELKSK